jgi:hypothetical protein
VCSQSEKMSIIVFSSRFTNFFSQLLRNCSRGPALSLLSKEENLEAKFHYSDEINVVFCNWKKKKERNVIKGKHHKDFLFRSFNFLPLLAIREV